MRIWSTPTQSHLFFSQFDGFYIYFAFLISDLSSSKTSLSDTLTKHFFILRRRIRATVNVSRSNTKLNISATLWEKHTLIIEPRHNKRDVIDIRIILRGGQSKWCISMYNVWFSCYKSGISPPKKKKKDTTVGFPQSVFHTNTKSDGIKISVLKNRHWCPFSCDAAQLCFRQYTGLTSQNHQNFFHQRFFSINVHALQAAQKLDLTSSRLFQTHNSPVKILHPQQLQ